MICAGVIHGDLSEFNVLVDRDGPVIIDLPQAVDAAGNNNAAAMLLRDAGNITTYFAQFAPALASTQFGKEIWGLYERGAQHELGNAGEAVADVAHHLGRLLLGLRQRRYVADALTHDAQGLQVDKYPCPQRDRTEMSHQAADPCVGDRLGGEL